MTNHNEDEIDYEKQITYKDINRPERRQRHKYTKYKSASIRLCLYVLIKPKTTFKAQLIKKLRNTEAELKKGVADKKRVFQRNCRKK